MRTNGKLRVLAIVAATLVTLALGLISLVLIGYDTGLVGFLMGAAMATVPLPFYIAFILWIDHFEPEPWSLLALVFVWGAAIASFVALIFNSINSMILTAAAGEAGDALTSIVSAPFVEELAKGIALFILFFWKRDQFDNVTDGIVYASMVGLGFAMTENVAYYGRAMAEGGVPSAGVLFFLRGIMSPFAHPLFTSMAGIGLGAARESDREWVKWVAPVAGLAAAMALHMMWNLSASFGALFFVMYAFVMVPALIAVGVVAFFSVRREARVVRIHLDEIVGEGVLSSEDVVVLCSPWARFSASVNALASSGPRGWRTRSRFHRAATDFAFRSWRVSRGVSDAVESRAALVDAVRRARSDAGLPPVEVFPDAALVRRLTSAAPLPSADVPPAVRSIRFVTGTLAGRVVEVGPGGLWIGRDPASAQVVVPEPLVSKRHVWLGYRDGGLVAIDRGSTNGTTRNGVRITETRLEHGDRLTLAGVTDLEILAASADAPGTG